MCSVRWYFWWQTGFLWFFVWRESITYKKTISTQKQPSCKKMCALCKMAGMKMVVKYRWQPRNGCDGRSNLITTIQVNLCCLIPASLGIGTKFTWIVIIKIFVTDLPSQPFLGRHLYFISQLFSYQPFCIGPHLFFSAWLFLSRYHIFL